MLNCAPCVPACQRGLRANVLAYQRGLRAYVPAWFTCLCAKSVPSSHFYVPTCQWTCQRTKRRANLSNWRVNMPKNVPIFQTSLLWNARGNFYTSFLYKRFYIMLDITPIHMCICIAHKNLLYFISVLHSILKESVWNFCFLNIFCS